MGNHELYLRRRQPETDEIIKLRQEFYEERLKEEEEQARRVKEHEERQIAEAKQREYEGKLNQANMIIQSKDNEIAQAHEQVQQLERELAELSSAKDQLKSREEELNNLNEQLQSERVLGEEERQRLTGEINEREGQIVKMKEQIESATTRTTNLQREVSRRNVTVMSPILESPTDKIHPEPPVRQIEPKRFPSWNAPPQSYAQRIGPARSSNVKSSLNVQKFVQKIEPATSSNANIQRVGSTVPLWKANERIGPSRFSNANVQRVGSAVPVWKANESVVQRSESHVPASTNKWSTKPWQKNPPINRIGTSKWTSNSGDARQERISPNSKWDVNVQEKLKAISQKLEGERNLNAIAKVGFLDDNETVGRNRRQTISKIQSGNTKNRVKQFENL